MAGLLCVVSTAEIALVAATAKTILQLTAPTNQRLLLRRWGVSFDGVSVTGEPVQVRLLYQTTAGTGTASPPAAVKIKPRGAGEAVQTVIAFNFTAEPTAGDIARAKEVHPQSAWEEIIPEGREIEVAGAQRIAIDCTAPAAVNVRAELEFEE